MKNKFKIIKKFKKYFSLSTSKTTLILISGIIIFLVYVNNRIDSIQNKQYQPQVPLEIAEAKFPVQTLDLRGTVWESNKFSGSITNNGTEDIFNATIKLSVSKSKNEWIPEDKLLTIPYKIKAGETLQFSETMPSYGSSSWWSSNIVNASYYNGEQVPTPAGTVFPTPTVIIPPFIVVTPTPTLSKTLLISPISTPTQKPQQYPFQLPSSAPFPTPNYWLYKSQLESVLAYLNSDLASVYNQLGSIPAGVTADIYAIEEQLQYDLANIEREYNTNVSILIDDLNRRGVLFGEITDPNSSKAPYSGYANNEIKKITDSYNNKKTHLINIADIQEDKITGDAEYLATQLRSQGEKINYRMKIIEDLLAKIKAGTFTSTDIPLALAVMRDL